MLTPGNNRIFGLDLLRACAILFVLLEHGYYLADPAIKHGILKMPIFDGVTIFFVLSGFLIGRILLRTLAKDTVSAKALLEFWIRRWFRTLPNYFLVLTLLTVIAYSSLAPPENFPVEYYLFLQNFASPHPRFFGEAWSLSIEEWFYLLVPILMLLTAVLRPADWRKLIPWWIAFIIILVTAFRFYRAYHSSYQTPYAWEWDLRKQVVTRFDSLMFGVLGAYLNLYRQDFWQKAGNKVFAAGMALLLMDQVFCYASQYYVEHLTLSISAIGTLLLLPRLSALSCNSRWVVAIVTFFSLTSYSIYLLNYTLVQGIMLPVVMRGLTGSFLLFSQHRYLSQYLLYWMFTLAASTVLYQYYERPMTALRERFHARGRQAVTAFAATRGGIE